MFFIFFQFVAIGGYPLFRIYFHSKQHGCILDVRDQSCISWIPEQSKIRDAF